MCTEKAHSDYSDALRDTVHEKLNRLNMVISNDEHQTLDGKQYKILMIDHDLSEVERVRDILDKHNVKFMMQVIDNGQDALKFLEREGEYSQSMIPDLIIVNRNLPKIRGGFIVKFLHKNRHLAWIPKIVISDNPELAKNLTPVKKGAEKTNYIDKKFSEPQLLQAMYGLMPFLKLSLQTG